MRFSSSQIEAIKQETEHFFGAQAEARLFGSRDDKHQRGFTLVELIMTMVIIGIIAAVAAPRLFDSNVFQSRGFADQVKASLRYAQKVAIAQHRFVCVDISSNTVTLNIDTTPISSAHTVATCPASPVVTSNMTLPEGGAYRISRSGATVDNAYFNFDALGRPSAPQPGIAVGGVTLPIIVEVETGYVR